MNLRTKPLDAILAAAEKKGLKRQLGWFELTMLGIGAVIGTVIIEGVSFWLSDNYRDIWPIILGVLLLLVIMFRPLGLISFVLGERERVGSFGKAPKETGNAAP